MDSVAAPLVGMVAVRAPVVAPKSPSWATVTSTVSGASGAGVAVTVKLALAPSVIALPAVIDTRGAFADGSTLIETL